jgi:hypothetical protein
MQVRRGSSRWWNDDVKRQRRGLLALRIARPRGKPRHHLGRDGAVNVAGTFENHAVSKTCLAIC